MFRLDDGVKDARVRKFLLPKRVVWSSPEGVESSENLLKDDDSVCTMKPGCGAGILLDFGCELHGGIRLDLGAHNPQKPARVRIRFGESVSEAMNEPNQDHTIHDQTLLVPWFGHQEFGNTGFRFVRIDLLDEEAAINLISAKAVIIYHDLPYLGSFRSSDERLNEIWKMGAYTVHLCMQDYLWDGIKRDRLVWIGDIHPETRVVSAVFGRQGVVERSLDYVRDRTPLPGWMNGISSYSICWLISQRDWYMYHGSLDYLKEQKEYLIGLVDQIIAGIGEDGKEALSGWRFIEWPTARDETAIAAGLQAISVIGLKAGAELLTALGEDVKADDALKASEKAAGFVPEPTGSKQANALLALAGMMPGAEINSRILSVDPYRGISTFYGYYVLEARGKAGDYQGCLDLIRNYWGGMIDAGATTFWEHFELDWLDGAGRIDEIVPDGKRDIHLEYGDHCYIGLRHSFCHGWAAGPTAWLSEHVLGISPVSPGFRTVRIKPNLADLQYAEGSVPTPAGIIEVRHEKQPDGRIRSEISLPEGIQALA